MINIATNTVYFFLLIYQWLHGIFIPLRDPEAILCKKLKYGNGSLSKLEKYLLAQGNKALFKSWYEQIRPQAINLSQLAKDCYLKTFESDQYNRSLLPIRSIDEEAVTTQSKTIAVFPIQSSFYLNRWQIIKKDFKSHIFEICIQLLANMYDNSIFWGDGDGKPCGILNNDNVLETSIVKCDTCDDIAGYEISVAIPKMLQTISYPYRNDLKWYMHPSLIDKVGHKVANPTGSIYEPGNESSQPKMYGNVIQESKTMPNNIRHPYPILLANLAKAYCFVDKIDEFTISRVDNGNNISYVLKCNIGGEVLRPEAISLLKTM